MNPAWIAAVLITVAGVCLALQAPINGALGRHADSVLVAAAISFGVGFVLLASLSVVLGQGALALGQIVAAILLDRFGAFGLPVREISVFRVLAAAMVGGGLVLSRF